VDEKRFLECLDADFTRLREVVPGALGDAVPSCPGWTGADLAKHVAEVYVDKAETIRLNKEQQLPPALSAGEPLAALDAAYRKLLDEFARHEPTDEAASWYKPGQTVGWWIRRMAQETVIHRVDAELTAGVTPTAIPADIAADGIDEVLVCFLAYATTEYPDYLREYVETCDGATVRVDVPEGSWVVQLGPDVVTVERGNADVEAVIRGEADPVLRWLWRRTGNESVELDGNRGVVGKLHQLLGVTTQ
jgi:uncharacterized protein (TIGR03083 family)